MFDRIQPTPLRITIRVLAMMLAVTVLTLISVIFSGITGFDSQFWVGWVSAFFYFAIFPSMRVWDDE